MPSDKDPAEKSSAEKVPGVSAPTEKPSDEKAASPATTPVVPSDELLQEMADRKLKDENAKRRIENKKLQEELTAARAELAKIGKTLGGDASIPGDADSITRAMQDKMNEQEAKLKRQAAQFAFISIAVKKRNSGPRCSVQTYRP